MPATSRKLSDGRPAAVEGILFSPPPYHGFQRVPGFRAQVPEGSVVALRFCLPSALRAGHPLLVWIREVRRALPSTLLVAFLSDGTRDAPPVPAVRWLARVGVRASVIERPTLSTLRGTVRASGVLDRDVATWLRIRLAAATPEELGICEGLGGLVAGAHRQGREQAALKRTLRKLGLPRLHTWKMLAKVLPPVVALQTDPTLPVVEAVAGTGSGYESRRSLDYGCVALTGLTARRLGAFLGWEVVLERMIGRKSA